MKRDDFKDASRFEDHGEQSLSEFGEGLGTPLKVRRFKHIATGQFFQVSEASNRYRQTSDASERVTASYGDWQLLR